MKFNVQKFDPIHFHERCMSQIPQLNDSSFLIRKGGHVGLSALAILTGTLAVARELVVGTVRLVPGQLVAIPVGMVRLIKKDWLKEVAQELSFNKVVASYDRACSQLLGVAVSIMALAAELIFYQHQAGANENYGIQVKLGNVKNDQRPALEEARIKRKKEALGITDLPEIKTALTELKTALTELKTALTELKPKVEGQQIQLNVLYGANNHLTKWLDECKKELAGVKNDLSNRTDVQSELLGVDSLEIRLKEVEEKIATLDDRLAQVEEVMEQLDVLFTKLEATLPLLVTKLKEKKEPPEAFLTFVEEKLEPIKTNLDLVKKLEAKIVNMSGVLDQVVENVEELDGYVTESQTKLVDDARKTEDKMYEVIDEVEQNCIKRGHKPPNSENAISRKSSSGLAEIDTNRTGFNIPSH